MSVTYSPGRVISAEYCVLYFLNLICVIEFIVDVYRNPPNWMQCISQIRLVALLLFAVVLVTLYFDPGFVLVQLQGAGIRLLGGSVANMGLYPEIIAIVSAYTFLHALESRARSMLFFLVGLAGTMVTQSRGAEFSLVVVLLAIAVGWGKMGKRSAYILIVGLTASMLIAGVVLASIGGGRIWNTFNRGGDTANLFSASGRTGVWESVIEYCISHPQGMGYIAGIRTFHGGAYSANLSAILTKMGGTDNSFMEVLADAGWLALALYLAMLAKTIALGWRSARRNPSLALSSDNNAVTHPLRCALFLLFYCLMEGMEGSVYATPMQGAFYCQNIFIAIILGASASVLIASRSRTPFLAER
jgi:O-antigen ligase